MMTKREIKDEKHISVKANVSFFYYFVLKRSLFYCITLQQLWPVEKSDKRGLRLLKIQVFWDTAIFPRIYVVIGSYTGDVSRNDVNPTNARFKWRKWFQTISFDHERRYIYTNGKFTTYKIWQTNDLSRRLFLLNCTQITWTIIISNVQHRWRWTSLWRCLQEIKSRNPSK